MNMSGQSEERDKRFRRMTTFLTESGKRSSFGKKEDRQSASAKMGDLIHSLVQSEMAKKGLLSSAEGILVDKEASMISRIDAISRTGEIVEIKTISQQELMTMSSPRPEHVAQVLYYLRTAGESLATKTAQILYVAREAPGLRRGWAVEPTGSYQPISEQSISFMVQKRGGASPEKLAPAMRSALQEQRSNEFLVTSYSETLEEIQKVKAVEKYQRQKKEFMDSYKLALAKTYEGAFVSSSFSGGVASSTRELMTPFGSPDQRKKVLYQKALASEVSREMLSSDRQVAQISSVMKNAEDKIRFHESLIESQDWWRGREDGSRPTSPTRFQMMLQMVESTKKRLEGEAKDEVKQKKMHGLRKMTQELISAASRKGKEKMFEAALVADKAIEDLSFDIMSGRRIPLGFLRKAAEEGDAAPLRAFLDMSEKERNLFTTLTGQTSRQDPQHVKQFWDRLSEKGKQRIKTEKVGILFSEMLEAGVSPEDAAGLIESDRFDSWRKAKISHDRLAAMGSTPSASLKDLSSMSAPDLNQARMRLKKQERQAILDLGRQGNFEHVKLSKKQLDLIGMSSAPQTLREKENALARLLLTESRADTLRVPDFKDPMLREQYPDDLINLYQSRNAQLEQLKKKAPSSVSFQEVSQFLEVDEELRQKSAGPRKIVQEILAERARVKDLDLDALQKQADDAPVGSYQQRVAQNEVVRAQKKLRRQMLADDRAEKEILRQRANTPKRVDRSKLRENITVEMASDLPELAPIPDGELTFLDLETSINRGSKRSPWIFEFAASSIEGIDLSDQDFLERRDTVSFRSKMMSQGLVNDILGASSYHDLIQNKQLDIGTAKRIQQEFIKAKRHMSHKEQLRRGEDSFSWFKETVSEYASQFMEKDETGSFAYREAPTNELTDTITDFMKSQDEMTTQIHEHLKDKKQFAGHNVKSFDLPILQTKFEGAGLAPLTPDAVHDTLRGAHMDKFIERAKALGMEGEGEELLQSMRLKTNQGGKQETFRTLSNLAVMFGIITPEQKGQAHEALFDVTQLNIPVMERLSQASDDEIIRAFQVHREQASKATPDSGISQAVSKVLGGVAKAAKAQMIDFSPLIREIQGLSAVALTNLSDLQEMTGDLIRRAERWTSTQLGQSAGNQVTELFSHTRGREFAAIGAAALGVASLFSQASSLVSPAGRPMRPRAKIQSQSPEAIISSDDEKHRSVMSMVEGNQARDMRHGLTDFGSGFQGGHASLFTLLKQGLKSVDLPPLPTPPPSIPLSTITPSVQGRIGTRPSRAESLLELPGMLPSPRNLLSREGTRAIWQGNQMRTGHHLM